MLVFLDSKGAVTATAPSTTGRNSAAMSTIYIVAPISGAAVSLSFRLPNGDEVNPDLADTVHNAVEILKGVDLPAGVHVWSYAIPKSVTAISGTVMYTITTTTESFVATGSGTFVVAPATTKTLPSSAPGADVWEEILSELARIYAEMRTVLGTSPVTGLDGLSTTVTALISKIASLIGNEPIESPIGGATTISTLLDWLKDESVRFSAVIGGGSISFAGSLIEAVNTLRAISVVKTSDPSRVYATASDGSPAFLPYAETPTAYSVPQRDGAGRVKTASPASASDAVDFRSFSDEKERVGKLITDLQTAVNRLSRAFAFDTWEDALVELNKSSLEEAKEKYKIGDAILIRDVEAPDGWVSGYAVSPDHYPGGNNIQNPFDGTDAFTVGWLIISPLEAPKLSLDGYVTTDDLNEYGEKVDSAVAEAKEYVDKVVNSFDPPSADKVERLAAEVANLTARIAPEYFTTDSSVAYLKTVPSDALPFAEVQEVGGMTHKCNNLVKSVYSSTSNLNGITVERSVGASSVVVNGTSTKGQAITLISLASFPTGEYTMSVIGLNSTDYLYIRCGSTLVTSGVKIDSPKTFTITESDTLSISASFVEGSSYSSKEVCLMLNKGTTALLYESHYDGLRNAAVTAIESVGKNLQQPFDSPSFVYAGVTFTTNADGAVSAKGTATGEIFRFMPPFKAKPSTAYTFGGSPSGGSNSTYYVAFRQLDASGERIGDFLDYGEGSTYNVNANIVTAQLGLCIRKGTTVDFSFFPYAYEGRTEKVYIPYAKRTYPIHDEVKALEGWGLGVNETYHNRLDWEKKQYRQEVAKIRLPSNSGGYNATNNWYYIGFADSLGMELAGKDVLCNLLPSVNIEESTSTEGICINYSKTHVILRINGFADQASYRAWLAENEVYIIGRLATPIVTDLPNLSDDNFIEVSGGGTITAVNEHALAAPTKIEYQLKEATA